MTIEAIAVDIDGTITDDKRQICISAIEALRKAEKDLNDMLAKESFQRIHFPILIMTLVALGFLVTSQETALKAPQAQNIIQ